MAVKKKPGQQGGGNVDPDDDDGDGAELTDGMRTEITNLVNAAVSGQLNRKLPNAISSALESGLKPLQDQIAGLGGRRRAAADDDGGDDDDDDQDQAPARGKKGKQQPAARKDPETENMKKRLAQLEEERKTEREQARSQSRDTLLREQLEAAGVDKNRIRGAVAVLRDSMKYDDKAGEWVYKAKRDGYEDDLDVNTGVAEWAATDEGKSYLAPPAGAGQQRGGSGQRPAPAGGGAPRLQNGGRPIADPKQAKAQAKADAVKNLAGAIDSLGGGTIPLG